MTRFLRQRFAGAGLAALLSAFLLAGCKQAAPKTAAAAPVPVTVARAELANVPTLLQAIGSVQSIATVSVKSLVGGEMKTVQFQQGGFVRKGQVLFTIDSQPFQAALAQAQANLARDVATNNTAQVEARRYADLQRQGIVSAEQSEQMQAVAAADASIVSADRAAVQTARLNLSYCTIRSPIDGRTGSLLVQAGNVVEANSTVLVTINQIAPIYVSFSVPEQYLSELKHFHALHPLRVQAQSQADPTPALGQLSFINNSIDSSTGTIQLMATFPNQNQRLWPGEYVNTEITLSVAQNATVVPSTAVLTGNDDVYVYLLQPDHTVQSRSVTTAASLNGMTVVTKGIRAGDTVVTDGQLALYPGAKVSIRGGGAPTAASASTAQAQ